MQLGQAFPAWYPTTLLHLHAPSPSSPAQPIPTAHTRPCPTHTMPRPTILVPMPNAPVVHRPYAPCRQYGKDYVALEDVAHAAGKGVWQGEFQIPSDWRKANKRGEAGPVQGSVAFKPSDEAPVVPKCPNGAGAIKGNINASGEKIYHVPGGRYYESVRIDLPDGEKFFCSEAEAVAAGWRKSAQ